MLKKILLAAILGMLLIPVARAEEINIKEIVDKVPALNNGLAFSFVENNLNYLGTFDVFVKGPFTVSAGYAGAQPNTGHKLVAVVGYTLFDGEKSMPENPILKYADLSVGIWGGAGGIGGNLNDAETDWGISLSLLKARFW